MICPNCDKLIDTDERGNAVEDHLCHCPECLDEVNSNELEMFGGYCEQCFLELNEVEE